MQYNMIYGFDKFHAVILSRTVFDHNIKEKQMYGIKTATSLNFLIICINDFNLHLFM